MAGIAGRMTADGAAPSETQLDAMADAVTRRGPDGRGHYIHGDVGLVRCHVTVAPDEPTVPLGPDAQGAVVAGDMAADEAARVSGLRRDHGADFAASLREGHAVAIHAISERELTVSRDRFGTRPLYYAEGNSGFAFASTPAALLAAEFGGERLSDAVRGELLQLQFVTGVETPWRQIRRVLPGETLTVRRGRVVARRRLAAVPAGEAFAGDEDQALNRLDQLLRDSLARKLAGVAAPVLYLGGGVDSAVLLELMSELGGRPVVTLTAGFDLGDEASLARLIARRIGADHHEIRVTESEFWRRLPAIVSQTDDPVADYGLLPMWKLAATASAMGARVAVCGEGADELFAGYGRYRSAARPWWLGGRAMRHRGVLDRFGVLRQTPTGWRDGIVGAESTAAAVSGRTALQVAQSVDLADWLPNDLLLKQDRCLAAHGMEPRYPYLDGALAAFAYGLPDNFKVRGRVGKFLLRRWASDNLPLDDPFRRRRGLAMPVGAWLAKGTAALGELVARQPGVAAACDGAAVARLFRRGDKRAASAQWVLLYYALWHHIHMLGAASDGDILATLEMRP